MVGGHRFMGHHRGGGRKYLVETESNEDVGKKPDVGRGILASDDRHYGHGSSKLTQGICQIQCLEECKTGGTGGKTTTETTETETEETATSYAETTETEGTETEGTETEGTETETKTTEKETTETESTETKTTEKENTETESTETETKTTGGITPYIPTVSTMKITTEDNQYFDDKTESPPIDRGSANCTEFCVPTIRYIRWINDIRILYTEHKIITKIELKQCEEYAKLNPKELLSFLNIILQRTKIKITKEVQYICDNIIEDIQRHIWVDTLFLNPDVFGTDERYQFKYWKEEITRVTKKESIIPKNIVIHLNAILDSVGASRNLFPFIDQIEIIYTNYKVTNTTKTMLLRIEKEIKRSILCSKISYLLSTFDRIISEDVKIKLTTMITSREVQVHTYESIVKYVKTLIKGNTLSVDIQTELKTVCIKLGVKGIAQAGSACLHYHHYGCSTDLKFITKEELIVKLSTDGEATFNVKVLKDCNRQQFCNENILQEGCPYGWERCGTSVVQSGTSASCTVTVTECKQETSVKALTTDEMIEALITVGRAETICFSQEACKNLCSRENLLRVSKYGGVQWKMTYSPSSKTCTVTVTGVKEVTPWVDGQCNCIHDTLGWMDSIQVGNKAPNTHGIKFKTADKATCDRHCDPSSTIPSTCKGSFSCYRQSTCWPGSFCACTIKHTCSGSDYADDGGANKSAKPVTLEETVQQPFVIPEGSEAKIEINIVVEIDSGKIEVNKIKVNKIEVKKGSKEEQRKRKRRRLRN